MKLSKPELEAVMATSTRTFVPFHKLVLSAELQARPEGGQGSGQSLPELAASIHAAGLLHNLVVVRGAKGQYEVCAGGRRWRAMGLLVADGRWPENQPVPVLVVPAEQALLASLVENVQREAMHPADEFEAFARLVSQGRSVEDVAAVFGVTPRVVQRRLRLAAVAPELLAEYRAGRIGLDCLMVLASVDGHERQQAIWAEAPAWARNADQLRRLLAREEVEARRDPVARFVGVEAYEAAAGPVRRDLFSDEDELWLLDPVLLDRLAIDKLQPMAEALRAEGWRWIDVRARYAYEDYRGHEEVRRTRRDPTDEEAAAAASLESRIRAVQEKLEAMSEADDQGGEEADEAAYEALESEEESLQSRLMALHSRLATFTPASMAVAGCVLFVGPHAQPEVKRGLIRVEDRAASRAAGAAVAGGGDAADAGQGTRTYARSVHSDRLMRRLTAHRVAAIQAELLRRPDVALAALVARLASELLTGEYGKRGTGLPTLDVSASDTHDDLRREGEDVCESQAWKVVEAQRAEWETALPQDAEDLLPWLLAQEQGHVLRLLAFLVATTVKGVDGIERESRANDGLACALGLDMSRWWEATGASYLAHVSKARILEVVTEAAGAQAAAGLAGLKKDGVVAGAERLLAGTSWLPRCLQTPPARGVATRDGSVQVH